MSGADDNTVWIDGFHVEIGTPVHKRLLAARATGQSAGGDGEGPVDYKKLKQPALKELLDEREIEYPSGSVKNADLIELLEADDAEKSAGGDGE